MCTLHRSLKEVSISRKSIDKGLRTSERTIIARGYKAVSQELVKINGTRVSSDSSQAVCAVTWAPHISQAYCCFFSHILFIMTRCIYSGVKRVLPPS